MTKEELVNLCKEGDKQALSLLYTTYANKMKTHLQSVHFRQTNSQRPLA